MNRSRLIGGIICLLIAGALTVANIRLPEEDLMFQIGDVNMPWIPPVVLAVVGVILLATSFRVEEAQVEAKEQTSIDHDKAALNKRLEGMAWGAFLIMLGGFMFVPDEIIKGGWWSIGVGLIMLGLNAARYFNGLKMSGFTTFLGLLSVLGGILDLVAAVEGINAAVLLIVLGAYLLVRPFFEKRQLFGKAEES